MSSSSASTGLANVLQRIMTIMKSEFKLQDTISSDLKQLSRDFKRWIAKFSAESPLLIIIDAIDQLQEFNLSELNLSWIPGMFGELCSDD